MLGPPVVVTAVIHVMERGMEYQLFAITLVQVNGRASVNAGTARHVLLHQPKKRLGAALQPFLVIVLHAILALHEQFSEGLIHVCHVHIIARLRVYS